MNSHYYSLAHDHWKEFLPTMYLELVETKSLKTNLERAVELTEREMTQALEAGTPRDQAWEAIKGRYFLIQPETDNDEDYGENPNQAFHDLMRETHKATQAINDDL